MRKPFLPVSSHPARPLAALALLLATAGTAQAQTSASFASIVSYSTGTGGSPTSVAVGDVNGDGRPDLVTANSSNIGTGTAGVLLGLAGGGFAAMTNYPTGSTGIPQSVAVADVNGDGRPDLVAANGNSTVGVLLGRASGGFAAATTYPTVSTTFFVAVADVNGDGRPDLVAVNSGSNTIQVLLGQAGGGFANGGTYLVGGGSPAGVAVADVNGDGRADLVTANNNNTAGVLLGQAGGGFAAAVTYPTGGTGISGVAVADVNGDGRPDLVTANYSSVGTGTAGVLLRLAGGGFAAVTTYSTGTGSRPTGVAVADVNGDGRLDIVTANYPNTAGVLLGQTGGGFAAVTTYSTGISSSPLGVAVADVNGDGRPDIVTANSDQNAVGVLLNTGTYTPLAAAPGAPAADDVALFPNPARGGFAVRLPVGWGTAPARAELLNALGQVVAAHTVVLPAGAALNFATDGLAAGVYVLRVQAAGHALAKRVLVD